MGRQLDLFIDTKERIEEQERVRKYFEFDKKKRDNNLKRKV